MLWQNNKLFTTVDPLKWRLIFLTHLKKFLPAQDEEWENNNREREPPRKPRADDSQMTTKCSYTYRTRSCQPGSRLGHWFRLSWSSRKEWPQAGTRIISVSSSFSLILFFFLISSLPVCTNTIEDTPAQMATAGKFAPCFGQWVKEVGICLRKKFPKKYKHSHTFALVLAKTTNTNKHTHSVRFG